MFSHSKWQSLALNSGGAARASLLRTIMFYRLAMPGPWLIPGSVVGTEAQTGIEARTSSGRVCAMEERTDPLEKERLVHERS